jgi:hypothetical protein
MLPLGNNDGGMSSSILPGGPSMNDVLSDVSSYPDLG